MSGRPWSIEDLGYVYEQRLEGVPIERIAEQVGRSWRAVKIQLTSACIGNRVEFMQARGRAGGAKETYRQKLIRHDQKFQEAMYEAGYRPHTNTEPGTERPRALRAEPTSYGNSVLADV